MDRIRFPRSLAAMSVVVALSCALLAAGCTDVRERQTPVARAPGTDHTVTVSRPAGCSRSPRTAGDGPRPGHSYIEWARSRGGPCCAVPSDRRRPSLESLLGSSEHPAAGR